MNQFERISTHPYKCLGRIPPKHLVKIDQHLKGIVTIGAAMGGRERIDNQGKYLGVVFTVQSMLGQFFT